MYLFMRITLTFALMALFGYIVIFDSRNMELSNIVFTAIGIVLGYWFDKPA